MLNEQQIKILEQLQTVKELQDKVLYADCKEIVNSIIKVVEGILGEEARLVELLEDYNELLFRAEDSGDPLGYTKRFKKQLASIDKSVKKDLS
jgi:hypothetical protein